jgi:hypothetical protein
MVITTMQFKIGSAIPDDIILKRFVDEDGEIFLEINGLADFLVRVSEGNRFHYKINKTHMENEELTLVADYSQFPSDPVLFSEQPTAVIRVPSFNEMKEKPENTADISEPFEISSGSITRDNFGGNLDSSSGSATFESPQTLDQKDENVNEWDEGQRIPKRFHHLCKKNDYGGYTMRHNKSLYLLDEKFRVDVKSVDTSFSYQLEEEPLIPMESESFSNPAAKASQLPDKKDQFNKGDILPFQYRDQCEKDIGPGGGIRATVGSFLYFMDNAFKITQKMKISVVDPKATATATNNKRQLVDQSRPTSPTPLKKQTLPIKTIVTNLIKGVQFALKKYQISADYFIETVLGPKNRDIMILAFNGDLTHLNDDTKEAAQQGKNMILQEKGFLLFKAILIHEIYIKSTLTGRGDNMKYFLSYIAAMNPDGTLGSFNLDLSKEHLNKVIDFFKNRAEFYENKAEIILRIHRQIKNDIVKEFQRLIDSGESIRFDAFLISKLYENTTRLDRGDGLTIIRLTRAILKFWESNIS